MMKIFFHREKQLPVRLFFMVKEDFHHENDEVDTRHLVPKLEQKIPCA